jgi:Mrp family chromosome partitioning ATPase
VEHNADLNPIIPFLGNLWTERWTIVAFVLVISLMGVLYVSQRSPSYTARALLLVENTRLESGRQELLPEMSSVDTSMVDSQVEIIKSEAIGLKVIDTLKLTENEEFPGLGAPGWVARIQNFLRTSSSRGFDPSRVAQSHPSLAVLPGFLQRLSVRRIGLSSVIEVRYKGSNPELSSRIVNEITEAYFADQAASAAAATASASAWLRDRIKDLGTKTRVISLATPPVRADGPRRLALLGVFSGFGLLLGVGFAVVRYALDTTLRNPSRAEARLGAPFLGAIGKLNPSSRSRLLKETARPNLRPAFLRSDLISLVRRIGVAAKACGAGPVIGVTSAIPGEGTTIIAANLAFSAKADGLSVLLVDGNAYEPALSTQFAPGASKGLTDIFAGAVSFNEARLEVGEAGLHFLPRGGARLANHGFNHSHVKSVAQNWINEYDLVVIDLPPLGPVPDLGLAGNMVDAFVLVVEWGRAPAALIESALANSELRQKGMLGFIFNKVKRSAINRFSFPLENYHWKYTWTTSGYLSIHERADASLSAPADLASHTARPC